MKPNTTHSPRPFRESYGSRQTRDIQHDLEFMRRMYAERRSLNHPRHQALIGWSLVTVMLAAPIVATILILIFR